MKKRESKLYTSDNSKRNLIIKHIVILLLIAVLSTLVYLFINRYYLKTTFKSDVTQISKINEKQVFRIDRIYLYSSANATDNHLKKPVWNLNLHQYTDIAIYINNTVTSYEMTKENTIKELTISDINFRDLKQGNPKLYYKDVNDFARFEIKEENLINDSLNYTVVNNQDADLSKPQIYGNLHNPITLEYVNSDIKTNSILSDITNPLHFDGSLFRKIGIPLNDLTTTVSFTITITNNMDQKFICNVYIDIPLESDIDNSNLYDGRVIKDIKQDNLFKFLRVK